MAHDLQILGFGAIAVDDIIYVDRGLDAGKGKVVRREQDHGGNVATALVAAARLGGRAGFIGWLRNPDDRDLSAAELRRHGVDVAFAPCRPDASPIRSTIIVDQDGNRFIAYDDDVPQGTSDAMPDATLASARVLLVDGYAVHALDVVAQARRLGLAVVADVEWSTGAATDRLLSLADHLVLPMRFAEEVTGAPGVPAMLDHLWSDSRGAVVLTDGGRGAYVRQKGDDTDWHIPAHAVNTVDTTGAGDCFHGAYAVCLAASAAPLEAALFASTASAIAVTGRGGRKPLPDRAQCLALMAGPDAPVPTPLRRAVGAGTSGHPR
ncbi:permease [Lichenibacterium minor]|uniref:Permease n=1 Tax=Lichenibacterium minor TaxID=2316528 RepID=A0A4Q2U6A7_9HYPH|nr:PfkB family carbohydrate kinase [Lichenibacterium minor]RYC30396.1 permease [Lichenibacterium minor]